MNQDRSLQFLQIAMKYLPEAKEKLEGAGVELKPEMIAPFMDMFTKVMNEAYELGRNEALNKEDE
ncbi:ComZ family protein [Bacillus massilinigeriensis]|uniref:ComZ family protein n=1 Tax=Bacillus mediterraneensis TaxID=1805474 RepID=UPI0008F8663A|nr:ComZ family protein [Bacillus mediterraneensis]